MTKIIPCLVLEKQKIISSFDIKQLKDSSNVKDVALYYSNNGADELLLIDKTTDDKEKEINISLLKEVTRLVDIPVTICLTAKKLEDVKKALYAGANKVILEDETTNHDLIEEIISRFGQDKVLINKQSEPIIFYYNITPDFNSIYEQISTIKTDIENGFLTAYNLGMVDIIELKYFLKSKGLTVNTFESELSFAEFKKNSDGMVPIITQDYKTGEVLMLAYMNEEAFNATIRTGKMYYFSRSRNELWLKGETSGHIQYVKSLTIDCDYDTILAKVLQVGAACHTGNQTCFFNPLIKKDFDTTNPLKVFEEEYSIILDRKKNPKEGSYTNYLFEKGMDKILKKIGEEATEMVIASKNPDADELKYEIADFLYHTMVLMCECNLDWKDIIDEFVNRR